MSYSSSLQVQATCLKKSLFEQGYLGDQFHQLEELEDGESPNFVEEVVASFFRDSARLIANIEQAQKCSQDFSRLDALMHQLKDSSSSIGASRLQRECAAFRECCEEEDAQECLASFRRLKKEHATLRQKLEAYFQLLRQAGPVEPATCSGS